MKFVVLLLITYSTDHNEILHTSQQWHCCDVCKILLWLVNHTLNQSTANFHRISNTIKIPLVRQASEVHYNVATAFNISHEMTSCEIWELHSHWCNHLTLNVRGLSYLGLTVSITYSIMMLVRFGDLSQSDCSKWVMWQVKDPQPRPGWDGCLIWEKVAFIKCVKKLNNTTGYLVTF